jgi:dTDP-4-dehydrorhamnose reductase
MLGSALCQILSQTDDVIGISRKAGRYTDHLCDLLDPALWPCLDRIGADVIVNTAALTNLMTCHRQIDDAYRLHVQLPRLLAQRPEKKIHISTDSVFDGHMPPESGYDETATPAPLNVYALTKLLGEDPVIQSGGLVIRTNIYGFNMISPGSSLFEWIVSTLAKGQEITGFRDIYFNPVSIFQLSRAIQICMIKDVTGLINIASDKQISKAEFLDAVISHVRPEFSDVTVQDAPIGEIIRPKRTPLNTGLAERMGLPVFRLDDGIRETSVLYHATR